MILVKDLNDPEPIAPPMTDPPWYVMLTEPQQDITTVWRLHELGLELYVPVIRHRVKTGRTGRNGQKVTRVIAKPMFPGYGFLRTTGIGDHRVIEDVRGVRDFLRDPITGDPALLAHQAVMAVYARQSQEHLTWLQQQASPGRGMRWKRGDKVRVDHDGGAYAGLLATVDKVCGKDRIQVLLGMIRHTLRADMVVAA
jgi:hypothetical protein